jgi:hypothetical protein
MDHLPSPDSNQHLPNPPSALTGMDEYKFVKVSGFVHMAESGKS